jgi:hypothetical protein
VTQPTFFVKFKKYFYYQEVGMWSSKTSLNGASGPAAASPLSSINTLQMALSNMKDLQTARPF